MAAFPIPKWAIVGRPANVMTGVKLIRAAINVPALIRINHGQETLFLQAAKPKKPIVGLVEASAFPGITMLAAVNVRVLFLPASRQLKAVRPENGGINKTAAAKITALIRRPAIIRKEAAAVIIIGILQAASAVQAYLALPPATAAGW